MCVCVVFVGCCFCCVFARVGLLFCFVFFVFGLGVSVESLVALLRQSCEHARFCVEVFLCAIYKFSFIHSFIHSVLFLPLETSAIRTVRVYKLWPLHVSVENANNGVWRVTE